jgi:cyanophycinase
VALHGGGEFLPGDEAFLRALLELVDRQPVRVSVLPVAAARHRPDLAADHGRAAFERVAGDVGIVVRAESVAVVDRASADDAGLAARLRESDIIHLPGGDPELVPATLSGTAAWSAIREAFERGAIVAGASAGGMGLAERTWTRGGWRDGLGLVRGLIVVPHFAGFDTRGWEGTVEELRRARLGQLGLDERTGVISGRGVSGSWQVAGEGTVHWFPASGEPVTRGHGEELDLAA